MSPKQIIIDFKIKCSYLLQAAQQSQRISDLDFGKELTIVNEMSCDWPKFSRLKVQNISALETERIVID